MRRARVLAAVGASSVRRQLRVLDGVELSCAGAPVRLPVSARRLLVFLALQERARSRMHVAFTLWPDASEAHAHGSLRSALFRLRSSGHRLVIMSAPSWATAGAGRAASRTLASR